MIAADILAERARLSPTAEALMFAPTGQRFTYGELHLRASARAAQLRNTSKLAPGDRVGLLCENRVEFLDCFFAAWRAGMIIVPLNTRLTATELEFIVRDNGMRCLVYSARFKETVSGLVGRLPSLESLCLDEPVPADHEFAVVARSPEETICLLYTSGTTGTPKGVMLSQRMMLWNAYNTVVSWQLCADDVTSIFTPLYHAGGLAVSLLPLFLLGARIVLHERFDAEEVWQTAHREQVTFLFAVPTIFRMLMDSPSFEILELNRLRWCISGGAPLPHSILECFHRRGIVLKQGYGLTEAGVNCFAMSEAEASQKKGTIGKPMLFTEVVLMHEGHAVAAGEIGEMWIRGPHVASGYWKLPVETAAAFDGQGWLHTGDLARCDADGFFEIVGRQKDVLISGGVNIYPAEIEAALLLHPAVEAAAVLGVPDAKWGEVPVGFVVTREKISDEDLQSFLGARLAKYKIPRLYFHVPDLPRSAYGKVLKNKLRATYLPTDA